MKIFKTQLKEVVLSFLLFISAFAAPLGATEAVGDKIKDWIHSFPWIGLIADEVVYGPITVSDLNLGHAGRLVFAKPGEKIKGTLRYKIDTYKLESMKLHHIIIGLKDSDAQSCISHSFGIWDKKGKTNFSFYAPMEKGLYEVRFDYQKALLCSDAIAAWQHHQPSSEATVGIIIVE